MPDDWTDKTYPLTIQNLLKLHFQNDGTLQYFGLRLRIGSLSNFSLLFPVNLIFVFGQTLELQPRQ